MYIFFSVLIIVVCVLLSLIVLVQNSKGGGMSSSFAANSIMGVRRTADFLEKATWTLAFGLMALSVLAAMSIPRGTVQQKTKLQEKVSTAVDPSAMSGFPTEAPQQQE